MLASCRRAGTPIFLPRWLSAIAPIGRIRYGGAVEEHGAAAAEETDVFTARVWLVDSVEKFFFIFLLHPKLEDV